MDSGNIHGRGDYDAFGYGEIPKNPDAVQPGDADKNSLPPASSSFLSRANNRNDPSLPRRNMDAMATLRSITEALKPYYGPLDADMGVATKNSSKTSSFNFANISKDADNILNTASQQGPVYIIDRKGNLTRFEPGTRFEGACEKNGIFDVTGFFPSVMPKIVQAADARKFSNEHLNNMLESSDVIIEDIVQDGVKKTLALDQGTKVGGFRLDDNGQCHADSIDTSLLKKYRHYTNPNVLEKMAVDMMRRGGRSNEIIFHASKWPAYHANIDYKSDNALSLQCTLLRDRMESALGHQNIKVSESYQGLSISIRPSSEYDSGVGFVKADKINGPFNFYEGRGLACDDNEKIVFANLEELADHLVAKMRSDPDWRALVKKEAGH
jgi:hypothetical protein